MPTPLTYDSFLTLARDSDLFTALERIQQSPTPEDAAKLFESLYLDAYWKHKDLPTTVALLSAGIPFCLMHAYISPDPAQRTHFLAAAKGLAYNLASFTWPGWDEPDLHPTPADTALGLHAARLNLRLAHDLQKPPEKIRAAHWLLGAHLLATDNHQAALAEFQQSVSPDPNESIGDRLMFEGYLLLAELLLKIPSAENKWQSLLQTLQSRPDQAAKNALAQLSTARRFFTQSVPTPSNI
jgi:hypothetical protein